MGEVNFSNFRGELRHCFIDGGEILENGNLGLSKHPSVPLQGSCLLLKIPWSKEEMFSFETGGFRFSLMDPFGPTIILDCPEYEAQRLVLRSRLLLLPLLAPPYCIYGLVLAKIRGVRVHRRVGMVEIPTMKSFSSDEISHFEYVENDHEVEDIMPISRHCSRKCFGGSGSLV